MLSSKAYTQIGDSPTSQWIHSNHHLVVLASSVPGETSIRISAYILVVVLMSPDFVGKILGGQLVHKHGKLWQTWYKHVVEGRRAFFTTAVCRPYRGHFKGLNRAPYPGAGGLPGAGTRLLYRSSKCGMLAT